MAASTPSASHTAGAIAEGALQLDRLELNLCYHWEITEPPLASVTPSLNHRCAKHWPGLTWKLEECEEASVLLTLSWSSVDADSIRCCGYHNDKLQLEVCRRVASLYVRLVGEAKFRHSSSSCFLLSESKASTSVNSRTQTSVLSLTLWFPAPNPHLIFNKQALAVPWLNS